MLAKSSFKDELARYDPEPVEIDAGAVRFNPRPDLPHIDRWAKDDRAQEVWASIKDKAPALEAQEFIRTIVIARHGALGLIQHVEERKALRNLAIKEYSADTLKLFASRLSLTEMGRRLEDLGKGLRDWADWPSGLFVPSDVKPSRKDQSGSRVRRIFVQQVSNFLHKHCGLWLDEQVAILTEIAFPGRELDIEDIRAMRRPKRSKPRATPRR